MPEQKSFLPRNLRYTAQFYQMYIKILPQVVAKSDNDIGQVGTYVVAVNHILKTKRENLTIGLIICKEKNEVLAQYAVESAGEPVGISEYELSKAYPADFKSSLPTIAEIEHQLRD